LDDGSVLGGVFSVQATTTAPVEGEEETPSQSFANILAYILHENVTFVDIQISRQNTALIMAKHWSDSKKELAAKLWANAELNTHQIAERLGCTYHALQLFAYRNRHILPKRGYGQMHRPNNKKIKLVAAKPVQITRYKDPCYYT
jgi:hypothetical protein